MDNSHNEWNRDSMEIYDDLKGLFDAMNGHAERRMKILGPG